MRTWKIACSAAVMALSLTSAARADEWNKLTLLTFSGPVDVPGVTLPAGTYRFQLADPESGRRVIRVDDKDGKKTYGIFLSLSNQKLEASDKPVVMFQESAAGAPPAVKVWFYPGETTGYEFVYPHDQALKIAKANHERVLTMTDTSTSTTTDAERVASMKSAQVSRVDENDKVSTDAELKESSSSVSTASTASTTSTTSTTTATTTTKSKTVAQSPAAAPSTTTAQTTTTSEYVAPPAPTPQSTTTAEATTAPRTLAPQSTPATTAERVNEGAVGTSGTVSPAPAARRRHLPATGSELPLMTLLSGLALAGGVGVRVARKSLA